MNWLSEKFSLVERIKNGTAQPGHPSFLPLTEIEVLESVFQHRTNSDSSSDDHVKALFRGLKNTAGTPFDPVLVKWCGDAWVLVDGHHRIRAYKAYEYDKAVPVTVFSGTLEAAIGEALRANVQDKLVMTAKEKTNAAWRLVVGTELSIVATAQLALVSKQTVKTMRKVRDALSAKTAEGFLGQLDWPAARARYDGIEDNFDSDNTWLDTKARRIADQLTKNFGNELSKYPKALWIALDLYDTNLAYEFCKHYGIDSGFLDEGVPNYDTDGDIEEDF